MKAKLLIFTSTNCGFHTLIKNLSITSNDCDAEDSSNRINTDYVLVNDRVCNNIVGKSLVSDECSTNSASLKYDAHNDSTDKYRISATNNNNQKSGDYNDLSTMNVLETTDYQTEFSIVKINMDDFQTDQQIIDRLIESIKNSTDIIIIGHYSVIDSKSFHNINLLMTIIKNNPSFKISSFILIASKIDYIMERQITHLQAIDSLNQMRLSPLLCDYFEVSSMIPYSFSKVTSFIRNIVILKIERKNRSLKCLESARRVGILQLINIEDSHQNKPKNIHLPFSLSTISNAVKQNINSSQYATMFQNISLNPYIFLNRDTIINNPPLSTPTFNTKQISPKSKKEDVALTGSFESSTN